MKMAKNSALEAALYGENRGREMRTTQDGGDSVIARRLFMELRPPLQRLSVSRTTFSSSNWFSAVSFWRIHEDILQEISHYWGTRRVVGNRTVLRSTVKREVLFRILCTGNNFDSMHDGAKIGDETVFLYFKSFIRDMKIVFKTTLSTVGQTRRSWR